VPAPGGLARRGGAAAVRLLPLHPDRDPAALRRAVELVDGADLDAWRRALSEPADLVFFETPGNPTLELVDIEAVAAMAHAAGARVVVDNVIATPLLQRPLELGADIVVYSATKHIDGQGRCLGGVILCDARFKAELLAPYLKHTGPALSPFNAWVLLKGLETLPLGSAPTWPAPRPSRATSRRGTRASSRCSTPASTTTRSAPWRGGRWRPAGASCPSAPAAGGPGPSRWRTGSGW
jgi:hypothetical protein